MGTIMDKEGKINEDKDEGKINEDEFRERKWDWERKESGNEERGEGIFCFCYFASFSWSSRPAEISRKLGDEK